MGRDFQIDGLFRQSWSLDKTRFSSRLCAQAAFGHKKKYQSMVVDVLPLTPLFETENPLFIGEKGAMFRQNLLWHRPFDFALLRSGPPSHCDGGMDGTRTRDLLRDRQTL